jgi:membrane protein implicated in regulation of membrane protease activity
MSASVVWLAVGLLLIVAEVLTGTFYLLVLGIACLAGAAVSVAAPGLATSSAAAAAVAIFGLLWVRRYRGNHPQPRMAPLDVGQTVRWESWIDEGGRLARVSYRDAAWEANIVGEVTGTSGEVLYITDVQGNRLTVSKRTD